MRFLINAFTLYLNVHLISGDKNFDKLFLNGVLPPVPVPPVPPILVTECFNKIDDEIWLCYADATNRWNITIKSPVKNLCCAEWNMFDCIVSVAQENCTNEEFCAVKKYLNDYTEYFNETLCVDYPKGTAQCTLEVLMFTEQLIDDRPPLPKPTVVDCFDRISGNVKRECALEARLKWNITRRSHTRPPIRNICCATWYDIDCLDQVVRIRCPSIEVTDTEAFFKQIEDWAANGACNQSTYHSQNCSEAYDFLQLKPDNQRYPIQDNSRYIRITEQYDDKRGFSAHQQTKFYFALNYLMSAFPQLLHMMIILAIFLITIVVIQCMIITRQVKQHRMITDYIAGEFCAYRKV